MITASPINARRISPTVQPSTRCVLIQRIRMGANAVLKLVKFMAAMMSTTQAIVKRRMTVERSAFGVLSKIALLRKWRSRRGVTIMLSAAHASISLFIRWA